MPKRRTQTPTTAKVMSNVYSINQNKFLYLQKIGAKIVQIKHNAKFYMDFVETQSFFAAPKIQFNIEYGKKRAKTCWSFQIF